MEVFQRDEDEWIVESLLKYESLYMFELQYPTRCLEWTRNGTAVSVAGFSLEHSNEIVQLSLPEKLLPEDEQTLWAKRDFKLINGVITKSPVTCLKYVNQSDLLLSSGCDHTVTIWAADDLKSDLLVKVEELELQLPPSLKQTLSSSSYKDHSTLMDLSTNSLLLGTSVSSLSLQMIDIESKKTLYTLPASNNDDDVSHSQLLHGVKFLSKEDDCVFVSCSGEQGSIGVWDRREPSGAKQKSITHSTVSHNYDIAVSSTTSYPNCKLAVLGASGQLLVVDGRKMDRPSAVCQCTDVSGGAAAGFKGRFSKHVQHQQPCVEFCHHSNLLSVSGVMNGLHIYDYSQWSCDMLAPTPLFVHHGHEQESSDALILVHSWQPGVERGTVFSCDSEGSLHAWQWKVPTITTN